MATGHCRKFVTFLNLHISPGNVTTNFGWIGSLCHCRQYTCSRILWRKNFV